MVSYLDVVTILLVFFIAAAAKTLAPPNAPQKTEAAPPPLPVAAPPPVPVATPQQAPKDQLRERFEAAGIEVTREPRGLVASFPDAVLFAPGDDRINASASQVMGRFAQILQNIPNRLIVVGHADAAPIHNRRFRNNWELSVARGMRVLELLSREYQIDDSRMSVSGDGSNRPAEANDTPEGRARNRRVEIVIQDSPEVTGSTLPNRATSADE